MKAIRSLAFVALLSHAMGRAEYRSDFDFSPVDSLDKVPAQFKSLYSTEAKDGKFSIPDTHKGVVEAWNGQKSALTKARQDAKAGKVDLSKFSEFGDNIDSIHEAVTTRIAELTEQVTKGSKIDLEKEKEKIKNAMTDGFNKELSKREARIKGLETQLHTHLIDNVAMQEIAAAKGIPALLMPHLKANLKVVEEGGKLSVVVIGPDGEPKLGITGNPLTIKEQVAAMKADTMFGRLFESDTQAGQGGGGSTPGGSKTVVKPAGGELSSNDKISQGLAELRRQRT